MRPVNIALDQDIRPERHDPALGKCGRRKPAPVEKWNASDAEDVRCHIQAHEINHVFLPRGTLQGGATLEQQRADVALAEALQRRPQRAVWRDRDPRALRLERAARRTLVRGTAWSR